MQGRTKLACLALVALLVTLIVFTIAGHPTSIDIARLDPTIGDASERTGSTGALNTRTPGRRLDTRLRVRLVDRNTEMCLSGISIRAHAEQANTLVRATSDEQGFVTFPHPGLWRLADSNPTNMKAFLTEAVEVDSSSKDIFLDGVGSVQLSLRGFRLGKGFAALVDASYFEHLVSSDVSIVQDSERLRSLLADSASSAIILQFTPAQEILKWSGVSTGRDLVLVISHQSLLETSPAHRYWYGEQKPGGRISLKGQYRSPCPVTRRFRVSPAKEEIFASRFAEKQAVNLSFEGFMECEVVSLALRRYLESGKQTHFNTWDIVRSWQQRPRKRPLQLDGLPVGKYRLNALAKVDPGRLLCSFVEFSIVPGPVRDISLATGIGMGRSRWRMGKVTNDEMTILISAKPHVARFGPGTFSVALSTQLGEWVEITGIPGTKGNLSLNDASVPFDLSQRLNYRIP